MRYFLSWLLYRLDVFHEFQIQPALGYLWRIKMLMRGVKLGKGIIFGRPVVKVYPGSSVELGNNFAFVSSNRR